MRVTLPVSGMTCAACQARVQRTLSRVPGVEEATVSLMLNSATVAYDPSAVSPQTLVDAVRATGYGAELPANDAAALKALEDTDAARASEFRDARLKAIVTLGIGLLAMAAPMPANAPVSPRMGAPWTWWALLAVTVFVMAWAGRHFYVRAWSALRHGSSDMNTLI